jgi:membrane protease YdiL (CAAX protease family)
MRVESASQSIPTLQELTNGRELLFFLAYTLAYVGYLFASLETEAGHWISLVLLPAGLIWVLRKRGGLAASPGDVLASVGLRRDWTLGLGWAFLLGALLSSLQLILSRNRGAMLEILLTGRGLLLLPVAFLLMLVMAGFTEEFFFRAVLQTRIRARTGSHVIAVLATSVLFGIYHLPYAYLNPRWPSHGDWVAAAGAAFGQALPAGVILGTLYAKRPNLLACVVVHAMINLLPTTAMLAGKR